MEDGEEGASPPSPGLRSPRKQTVWKLYSSRFLTAWGDRLWAFGFGLLLFEIDKTNLLLLAIYGFVKCSSDILFLPAVGNWIDQKPRLRAALTLLLVQNIFVSLNCILLGLYFNFYQEISSSEYKWLPGFIAAVVMFLALIANIASQGSKIVVEKDWIVVISGGDENRLADLNSYFRTIDLSCQTFAPIITGFVFTYTNYIVAAAVIGSWNVVSVILEYLLLLVIYQDYPELGEKAVKDQDPDEAWLQSKVTGSYRGWVSYMTHDVRNAGLALAFLYMTVLGFDNITWGYSRMQCVEEWLLGVLVAVSGLVGILGSRVFPFLRKNFGAERSGVIGLSCQLSCIALCVISVWLPGSAFDPYLDTDKADKINTTALESASNDSQTELHSEDQEIECNVDHTSIAVLLSGIILARFGLWIGDLSVTQILQENVEAEIRGVIGGVQTSLNSAMDLVKFVFVLVLPNANMFGILIILSFTFVFMGYISMLSYAFKKKKLCCGPKYEATHVVDPDKDQDDKI